jgi:hypothetical protein
MDKNLAEKVKILFEKNIKTSTIQMHCIEVEAVMRELALELGEDADLWAAAGLLHDLDFEENKTVETHAKKTVEILKQEGFPEEMLHAVLSHNEEGTGVNRQTKFDYALSASDNVSGLIFSYALMRKGIQGMDVSGLKKKMKDKRFAANVNRQKIIDIEKAGMNLDKFLEVSIKAMQKIADKIGFY